MRYATLKTYIDRERHGETARKMSAASIARTDVPLLLRGQFSLSGLLRNASVRLTFSLSIQRVELNLPCQRISSRNQLLGFATEMGATIVAPIVVTSLF